GRGSRPRAAAPPPPGAGGCAAPGRAVCAARARAAPPPSARRARTPSARRAAPRAPPARSRPFPRAGPPGRRYGRRSTWREYTGPAVPGGRAGGRARSGRASPASSLRLGERRPRRPLVGGQLRLQLVERGEAPLVAQLAVEAHGDGAVVEVAVEAEKVHLERGRVVGEARPRPHVGHAAEGAGVGRDRHGEDP